MADMNAKETSAGEMRTRAAIPMVEPVRKSIKVKASVERSFRVFVQEMDTWWPKSHHIGSSPMAGIVIEERIGGRVYSTQEDGGECQWASVLAWEPPHRFLMAWQVNPTWKFEADLAKCSEVEVTFTPAEAGYTLVELEHRYFERHGEGSVQMRETVGGEGGWNGLLKLFQEKLEA